MAKNCNNEPVLGRFLKQIALKPHVIPGSFSESPKVHRKLLLQTSMSSLRQIGLADKRNQCTFDDDHFTCFSVGLHNSKADATNI